MKTPIKRVVLSITHGLLSLAALTLCTYVNAQIMVSVQDGDWSSPSTWEGGIVPVAGNYSQIVVQNQVTLSASSIIVISNGRWGDDLVIQGTGLLTVDGILETIDSARINSTYENLIFSNGSTFRANSSTVSVIPIASWDVNSTLEIVGLTTSPSFSNSNLGQNFGNVIYDCPNQGPFVEFNGRLVSVAGDFTIRNTRNNYLRLANGQNLNLNIGGNFLIEGPSKVWCSTTTQNNHLSIAGDFIYKSSTTALSYFTTQGRIFMEVQQDFIQESSYRISLSSGAESGFTELSVGSDMLLRSGGLTAASDVTTSSIIFKGIGQQNFNRDIDFELLGRLNYTVEENSILNINTSIFSNTTGGSFVVGGTLITAWTGEAGALDKSTNGNFNIVGDLTFLSGSEVRYQGSGPQFIGNAVTDFSNVKTVIENVAGVSLLNGIQFGDLFVASGHLNTGDYELMLTDDLEINPGCSLINNGTISFNGVSDQLIKTSGSQWKNLVLNNSGSANLSIEGPVGITGFLSVVSAGSNVLSNSNLTLLSTSELPNGTAGIATLPGASAIIGEVTCQRFMTGIGDTYRYIGSPVSAATVASLMDDVPVTGTFANPSVGVGLPSNAPSLFEYDEETSQWNPYPTSGLASENSFLPGKGYCFFNWNNTSPTFWDVTGEINQGSINFDLSYTIDGDDELDGWNLIGNPYPSAIRWDEGEGWTRNSSVSMGVAVRDNALGGFRYWDGEVGELTDGRIALGQSFWVRSTGPNPQLTIHETAKVIDGASFYRKRDVLDYIELNATINGVSDKTYLRLREGASSVLDNYDIPKLANDLLSLSFVTEDNISVAIDAVGEIHCRMEIPLKMTFAQPTTGDLSLSLKSFGLLEGSGYKLYNELTGELMTVSEDDLNIPLVNAVKELNHFKIIIESPIPNEVTVVSPTLLCGNDSLVVQLDNAQQEIFYQLLENGALVESAFDKNSSALIVSGSNLREGEHTFQLLAQSACDSRIMQSEIYTTRVLVSPPAVSSSYVCQQGTVTLNATSDQLDVSYQWYENLHDTIPLHKGKEFVTPLLSKTRTYYVSALNSISCESERTIVEAEVIPYDDVVVTMEEGILHSSFEEGNQWFLNGDILSTEINSTLTPLETGVYSVEVAIGSCKTTGTFNYVISGFQESEEAAEILIYPNPSKELLFIRFRSEVNVELIGILTSTGTSVPYICTPVSDEGLSAISLADWPAGLYTLLFKSNDKSSFIRFVKR